jgi:hypothetical protein
VALCYTLAGEEWMRDKKAYKIKHFFQPYCTKNLFFISPVFSGNQPFIHLHLPVAL